MAKLKTTLSEKSEKSEIKVLFILAFMMWFLDFGTTLIALHYYGNEISEANPIAAYFFAQGPLGYLLDFILCAGLIWFIIIVLPLFWTYGLAKPLDYAWCRLFKKKMQPESHYKSYVRFLRILTAGMTIGQEGFVLYHNYITLKPFL